MKHTFVICAYKKSPYLEACIRSLKEQTIESEIILATSTPSEYLEELCGRYQLRYCVRNGNPGIAPDWNYAFACASTPYVTIAHQDDIYYPNYAERIVDYMEQASNPLIAFTDYEEYVDDHRRETGINLRIKRFLLYPLRRSSHSGSRFYRRRALRYGNAICCPSVTYARAEIRRCMRRDGRKVLFRRHFRSNLDWETWEWLSNHAGQFLYLPQPLMAHRIHEDSETTATIRDHQRHGEDLEMFRRFWIAPVARLLAGQYQKSEYSNRTGR